MILTASASKPIILWFMLAMKCSLAPDGNIDLIAECSFATGITPYLTRTQCHVGGEIFTRDDGGDPEQYRTFCIRRLVGKKGART